VTYEGSPGETGNRFLKMLVVLVIAWVAYWAATGGIDQIPVPTVETATETASE